MGFYNRDNLKLHELTSPRINCKLPGCLQIPKMLVQAAINGANTSSKLRPLAKPTSLLQEKKSARHTAQQRHFQVTSSRNVMSLFLSLGGGLIRSHVLPCFPFFGEMVRSYCTMLLPENIFSLQFERKTSVHSLPATNQQRSHKLKI